MTSSDVLDTALALQLQQACEVLLGDLERFRARAAHACAPPQGHALRRPQPRRPRRAHGVRAQAGAVVCRGRAQHRAAQARQGGGEGREDLRGDRHLRPRRPRRRGGGLPPARSRARSDLDPGRPARPPRGAVRRPRHHRRLAREGRGGDPLAPAHRDPGGRGAVRGGPEGLERHAAQAQPGRQRERERARAAGPDQCPGGARERRAVARAGHQPLLGRARHPAGLDHPRGLHAPPDDRDHRRAAGVSGADEGEHGAELRPHVLPARAAQARGQGPAAPAGLRDRPEERHARLARARPTSTRCWPPIRR